MVTSARAPHALAFIRSMGERGHEIVAGDSTRLSMGLYSKYVSKRFLYPSVTERPADFLRALDDELSREHYDLLFPTFEEIFLIARQRKRFAALTRVIVPSYEELMAVHNKGSLARLCAQYDIPTPETIQPGSLPELERIAPGLSFPVVIKLVEGNNSLGLSYAADAAALAARYRKLVAFFKLVPPYLPLVQRRIDGEMIYTLFLADHGDVVGQLIYRPLRMFPESGGTAFHREAIRHPAVEEISARFIRALKWHGFIGFDFILDGRGQPQLIDVNPRPNPAYNTGLAAGVDFTGLFLDLVDGFKPLPQLEARAGTRSLMFFVECLWFVFSQLPGRGYFRRMKNTWTWMFHRGKFVGDVHRKNDRLPSLILWLYTNYFMFIINTIKPSRGGFMFGCNYDRALADRLLPEATHE
jgi:predicted ATP-grasp superfamily ATP-dependent carboligase